MLPTINEQEEPDNSSPEAETSATSLVPNNECGSGVHQKRHNLSPSNPSLNSATGLPTRQIARSALGRLRRINLLEGESDDNNGGKFCRTK